MPPIGRAPSFGFPFQQSQLWAPRPLEQEGLTPDLIELRNLVVVADLIVRSALARKESRGLHYTLDYPDLLPQAEDTVLVP